VEKSIAAASAAVVGDPTDPATTQGPQVSKAQFDKIMGYIETAKAEGATLGTGGARAGDKGYFVEPTVFSDVTDDMTIASEEIFGPGELVSLLALFVLLSQ
jgi:aldehyde dehydrogenase (NAD+)